MKFNIKEKIKKIACNTIIELICSLSKLIKKFEYTEANHEMGYEDLTPKDNIDEDGEYSKAIKWALDNKRIKNIALTGPYGSGKSSILKTFQKEHVEFKTLNISLATFNMDCLEDIGEENEKSEIIENSILQQMFYKVKDKEIPYSRFKKIKKFNRISTIFKSVIISAAIASWVLIFKESVVKNIMSRILNENKTEMYRSSIVLGMLLLAVVLTATIYKIIKLLNKDLTINKITLFNPEIEVGEKKNKFDESVFNKHIDEIIYFFEATKYDVVVFEDLDRFKNRNIFIKLRELNTLVNNSDQINRKVVFIYAVKDEIFSDDYRERTKFFDFIIPAIPIINSSNSCEILTKKIEEDIERLHKEVEKENGNCSTLEKNRLEQLDSIITDNFISDISLYINDMRTINNIYNEFKLYTTKLFKIKLDFKKLLAMIAYKNIYPKDFSMLHNNKGLLFDTFKSKKKITNEQIILIENEIESIKLALINSNKEVLQDIRDLNRIYEHAIFCKGKINMTQTKIDGQTCKIDDVFKSHFELVKNATNIWKIGSFTKLEELVGGKSYEERKIDIDNKSCETKRKLHFELDELERKKAHLTTAHLKDIVNDEYFDEIFKEDNRDMDLLIYLIRNGFIDETYNSYITHFHEGTLSSSDMDFVLSIKNHYSLGPEYKLENFEAIVSKISNHEFKQKEILNFSLVNYLLQSENHKEKLESVIELLSISKSKGLRFIDNIINCNEFPRFDEKQFIKEVGKKYKNFWIAVEEEEGFDSTKKEDYLKKIIKYVDNDSLKGLNLDGRLGNAISKKEDFLSWFYKSQDIEKVKLVLADLNVKFQYLVIKWQKEYKLLDVVYNKNLYEINPVMLKIMIYYYSNYRNHDNLDCENYTIINEYGDLKLRRYVKNNIQEYVENVMLKLDNNKYENVEYIKQLLNNEKLSDDTKKKLLECTRGKIRDIKSITGMKYWDFINSKIIEGNWNNIIEIYKSYRSFESDCIVEVEKDFFDYIQKRSVLKGLSKWDCTFKDNVIIQELCTKIYENNEISINVYRSLIKVIPDEYAKFDLTKLKIDKIGALISQNKVGLSSKSFSLLKSFEGNYHITLLVNNVEQFKSEHANYVIDVDDMCKILKSKSLIQSDKEYIFNAINLQGEESAELRGIAIRLITQDEFALRIEGQLLNRIIDNISKNDKKIKLIGSQIKYMKNEEVARIISELGEPYDKVIDATSQPTIKNTSVNKELLIKLKEKNFISSFRAFGGKLKVFKRR